ncbi:MULTISPECIES: MDR family MFS transporter [Protofrankia]|uniref:Multidrug MFS transporter n=1 Tax=Protofrankia coriariae TaxID=1562887 RepID=A0ABR5F5E5_9ACTN|nr:MULTISPECIES: MDR family MFS transporter [Protofrankia]KLL11963.1 multidrug MFS transporter [Protofrankia coriariae]ONH36854.1 MFS transporter [Protofrankia sp. BMG5.30]
MTTTGNNVSRNRNPPDDTGTDLSHRQIVAIIIGLMTGMLLAALDQTIVATALPTIVGEFHRSDMLSWLVTAYLLTSTISAPLYGKASDLYGRKTVLQLSITIFLIGSTLCGLAQSMYQLVGFRALQGLGAGGLISLAFAVIGDIVAPRERGRYQGYFSGVFGASSILGPLVGGFLVDHGSWRWVFFVNLPVGLAALVVINRTLRLPFRRRRAAIDWAGAILLVTGLSAILLATQSGGKGFAWLSWQIAALIAAGVVLIVSFALRERVAPEAILPPRLFSNSIYTVCALLSLVTGTFMFGAIIFLPQYLQIVHGASATVSGLRMLPLLAGILLTSIGSGRLISATGHYKRFVVAGTVGVTIGFFLLSRVSADTGALELGLWMFVTGLGLGFLLQNVLLAVQNSVDPRDMGAATSSVTFLRTMGGAIGASALGAVLTTQLATNIALRIPGAQPGNAAANRFVSTPRDVAGLAAPIREAVRTAYADSLGRVFLVAVPIGIAAFAISLFLREAELRGSTAISRTDASDDTVGADLTDSSHGSGPGAKRSTASASRE